MTDQLKQFDIIYVNLDKKIGSEQSGIRPALVIQNDLGNLHCPTILILPLTTQLKKINQPTHVVVEKSEENGLKTDSMILAEALTSISKERIIKRIGHIYDEKEQEQIITAYLSNVVGYRNESSKSIKLMSMIFTFLRGEDNGRKNNEKGRCA